MGTENWKLKNDLSKEDILSILSDLEDKLIEYSTTIDRMHTIKVEAPRQDLLDIPKEINKLSRASDEIKLEIEKYRKMLRILQNTKAQ